MEYTVTWYNKNFRFVYTPNSRLFTLMPAWYQENINSDRFLVGAGSLSRFISKDNAETVLKSAQKMKTDKYTLRFRKYGKIEIYVK